MHVVVASHQQLPARGYGGPERVVVSLVRGLAVLGHRVTLLAPPGSRVAEAKVVEVPARKFDDAAALAAHLPRDADILHTHLPLKRGPRDPAPLPFVQTIHRNLKPGAPPPPNAIFLSRDHARRHASEVFVYNGLDPADYVFRRFPKRAEQFDLFLGKLHSAKGYHWAVEAAKRAGHRLVLAGGWRPSFTGAIKYVGEVDGTRKAALLARARCLWNPTQWDEPFGLVTIEAFLSGTPVLGTRRGALPELITPEVGALCETMEEMIAAAETIHTRRPEACRALAERHFTHLVMAEEYVRMYRGLLDTGKLAPTRPRPPASPGLTRATTRRNSAKSF
jgi:glycosyltransferase involved in cell wall biosynthesis